MKKFVCNVNDNEKHSDYLLVNMGRNDAIREIAKQEYKLFYYSNQKLLPKKLQNVIKFNEEQKNKDKVHYFFVTLNFSPKCNMYKLIPKFHDYLDLRFVEILSHRWEFTNEEGEYTHPHVHALVTKLNNRKGFITRTFNTFKKFMSDAQKVDVRSIPIRDFQDVLGYIQKDRLPDLPYREKYDL